MKKAIIPLCLMSLAACTTYYHYSNGTDAPIMTSDGRPVGQMNVVISTGHDVNGTTVTATSSDGEVFTGLVIAEQKTVVDPGGVSVDAWNLLSRNVSGAINYDPGGSHMENTNHRDANLVGNKGHTMACQFVLAHPNDRIIDGGTTGGCRISDGRYVNVSIFGAPQQTVIK